MRPTSAYHTSKPCLRRHRHAGICRPHQARSELMRPAESATANLPWQRGRPRRSSASQPSQQQRHRSAQRAHSCGGGGEGGLPAMGRRRRCSAVEGEASGGTQPACAGACAGGQGLWKSKKSTGRPHRYSDASRLAARGLRSGGGMAPADCSHDTATDTLRSRGLPRALRIAPRCRLACLRAGNGCRWRSVLAAFCQAAALRPSSLAGARQAFAISGDAQIRQHESKKQKRMTGKKRCYKWGSIAPHFARPRHDTCGCIREVAFVRLIRAAAFVRQRSLTRQFNISLFH